MKNKRKSYIKAFYTGNKLLFTVALLTLLTTVGTYLFYSWMLGEVLDIVSGGTINQLWELVKIAVVILVLSLGQSALMYWSRARFVQRALYQYKSLVFSKLSEKSISAFMKENTSRYISVLTNDAGSIEENYLNKILLVIYEIVLFICTLIMMFLYSWLMAVAVLVLCALPILVSVFMGNKLAEKEREVSDQNEFMVGTIKDLLSGFSVIKSFKSEKEAVRLFDDTNKKTEEKKFFRRWMSYKISIVSNDLCYPLIQMGIFFFGAYLAFEGEITLGTVLIMTNLVNSVMEPIRTVPQYLAGIKSSMALIDKLSMIMEENSGHEGSKIESILKDKIQIENLSFSYEEGKEVLKDIYACFEAGKSYAVVGGSGSGKSTLLQLLMGSYENYTGRIAIDGTELKTIDTDSLYDLISIIQQNVFVFDSDLKSNITMFRTFDEEVVNGAIDKAGLSKFIAERGADYSCGENGRGLSGGERQRISIARSLLRNTPVLMMDEATAALDNETAFAVTNAVLDIQGLTRIIVTHKLDESVLKKFDGIYVMKNGSICERGTFDELMDKKEYFYSLVTITA
ncbi:ABC transporter ATP-binding protein [Alloiococcus sp. CFN-8]|uniref:ABC transporter ATP-binding protein n=1 Tax=Alloiococcus sp. CFN-8 TaxID=3416081 RepID=UPI003CEE74FE